MVSSLDWYPTFAALSGASLDPSVAYDGFDVSTVLLSGAASPRDIFFYHSTKIGDKSLETGGLMALRKGPYKLHLFTQGSHCKDAFPDAACHASTKLTAHNPPLLFNVERDPGEVVLLTNSTWGEWNSTHTFEATRAALVNIYSGLPFDK